MADHDHIHPDPVTRQGILSGDLLPVMEMFYSIQGEGFHTGKPASFIRIGGCDVGCHWCDVKEGWNASLHPPVRVEDILRFVKANPARAVVITGGEPLRYNLDALCKALQEAGISIFLETCGAHPLTGRYDWICVSPKQNSGPRRDMLQMADELKVIVHEENDFPWAEKNALLVRDRCKLFLQPEWSRYHKILPAIVSYVKMHPEWMVSLQAHKFMRIP